VLFAAASKIFDVEVALFVAVLIGITGLRAMCCWRGGCLGCLHTLEAL
jgi:hypothetical protein